MKPDQLPDTRHELLTLAVADARSLKRSDCLPGFGDWHTPKGHGRCAICLAGAVLAGPLGCSPIEEAKPWLLSYLYQRKLEALADARCGNWIEAILHMHLRMPPRGIFQRLVHLPSPRCSRFSGWEPFDAHRQPLESIVPSLREIEREFLPGRALPRTLDPREVLPRPRMDR